MAKRKDRYHVTEKEALVLELFWKNGKELTSPEIMEKLGSRLSQPTLHLCLRSLTEKKLLKVSGFVLAGKSNVRKYLPLLSREEYAVGKVLAEYQKNELLPEITLALLRETVRKMPELKQDFIDAMEELT